MPLSSTSNPTSIQVEESPLLSNHSGVISKIEKPIVLSVEGNIGAGKSTFLEVLLKHFGEENVEVLQEPVKRWTDVRGENLLEAFYKDPKRYAYTFQTFAFITRLMEQQKEQKKPIRILERSALSDCCFAQNCFEGGLMNDLEWAAYQEWWSFFVGALPGGPDGILYLHTQPETCHSRMSLRNRSEEKGVPLEYLKTLHQRHEEWMPSHTTVDRTHKIPFIKLNADEDFEHSKENQVRLVEDVVKMINRIVDERSRK